jgi:hypothetical protein
MKELVEELAIKSGFKKYKNDDGLYSPYIEGYDLNDELEEFAELIIKECIAICEQTHDTPNGKMRCANDDESIRLIKEHFGVK